MQLKFISPKAIWTLTITDIVNVNGHKLEKADCNVRDIYMLADKALDGREILYE
jgi:hypothetical protein